MASEEMQGNNNTRSPAMAPVAPATLPPYPERIPKRLLSAETENNPQMILAAIEALNEENGSNKSSISKQIESTYGNLPPAHSTLLTHHLNRMRSTGQLAFLKNNYLKPDPNAPPRRGRGRPPKPKAPLPPGTILPSPRPRGRPPKSLDPNSPQPPAKPKAASTAGSVSGRKRGRPPKADNATGVAVRLPSAASGTPRGRGRPPKVKPAMAAPVGA